MSVKLNNGNNFEVLCKVTMDADFKSKYPIAYQAKKEELMEEDGLTEREAENYMDEAEITLELYYEKGRGAFAIDSEACDAASIYSPYTGEPCRDENGKLDPYQIREGYKAMGESLKTACIERLDEIMCDDDDITLDGRTVYVHCDHGDYGYYPRCAVRSVFKDNGEFYLELDECPRYPLTELYPDEMGELLKIML